MRTILFKIKEKIKASLYTIETERWSYNTIGDSILLEVKEFDYPQLLADIEELEKLFEERNTKK